MSGNEVPKKNIIKKIYLKNLFELNKRISWQVICKSNKVNDGKANVSEWERVSERKEK